MKGRSLVVALALLAAGSARAEEGRFDAQVFRPSAAPRDLVMVQKSETIAPWSPTVGIFYDLGFDPLVLINADNNQRIEAVGARMQLTGLVGTGILDWLDVRMAVPFVAWQTSDNLRVIGSEGQVQSTAMGDVRLTLRAAPWAKLTRRTRVTSGWGLALAGNVNLPSGSPKAFTGDGVVTGGFSVIGDYRFESGVLVAANAGIWLRPERQFAGVQMGDMASFGVMGEGYLVQSWGISVLGGMYGYPSLHAYPGTERQIPAEALMALRWQGRLGFTITSGMSFGAACGFGAPALRIFSSVTWQPPFSREQKRINQILDDESLDPDGDGLISDKDECPDERGPLKNNGCPDQDKDKDGIVDRVDECPDVPGPPGTAGCPPAFIKGNQIVIKGKVHFATDRDIILEESKPILEEVAQVLIAHPEVVEVRIEGHTDIRAGDAYNLELSQRRVESVRAFLITQGIAEQRLLAEGFGHERPLVDDTGCNRPDEKLDKTCIELTSRNRRVEFHITRWAKEKK